MGNRLSVTVVVPVYNVERYLRRCIESLLAQDYPALEIIMVDDGSSDNSGQICDEYAETYGNVKVLHKKNGGLSSARKAGYDIASGELIAFVDSDDFVAPQYVSLLATPFADKTVQLSICGYATQTDNSVTPSYLPYKKYLIENHNISTDYILPLIGTVSQKYAINIPGFVPIRMYRRHLLEGEDFVSEREYFTEDIIMNILYAKRMTGTIAVVNEPLYFYCVNPGSLTLKYRENIFSLLMARYEFCRSIGEDMDLDSEQLCLRLNGNLGSVVTRSVYNIGRIRNYRKFKSKLKVIFNQPQVKSLFRSGGWSTNATWHKIIYVAYWTKAYFILYKLLKTRKVI